jgi:hypothetical protein
LTPVLTEFRGITVLSGDGKRKVFLNDNRRLTFSSEQ